MPQSTNRENQLNSIVPVAPGQIPTQILPYKLVSWLPHEKGVNLLKAYSSISARQAKAIFISTKNVPLSQAKLSNSLQSFVTELSKLSI